MTVQSQFQIFSDKYLPWAGGPIWLRSRYKLKVPLLCPSSRSIEGRNIREGISVISNSLNKMPHNAADSVNIVFHFCLLWHWIRHKMYHKCCYSLTVAVESHPSMSRNMEETEVKHSHKNPKLSGFGLSIYYILRDRGGLPNLLRYYMMGGGSPM